MKSEEEVLVDVGAVTLKTIEEWADKSCRFQELISDERRFQDAFTASKESLNDMGVPMSYIEQISRELFDQTVKTMLTVSYAREAVKGFFRGKTVVEIERETISDEDWISEAVDQAIQVHMEAVIDATVRNMGPGITIVIDGFWGNDADDPSDD